MTEELSGRDVQKAAGYDEREAVKRDMGQRQTFLTYRYIQYHFVFVCF